VRSIAFPSSAVSDIPAPFAVWQLGTGSGERCETWGSAKDKMKANRINLVAPVRQALINAGYSTVKVVSAVNAELGKLGGEVSAAKLGGGRLTGKATEYRVSESVTTAYSGKLTDGLHFDAWHTKIESANKVAEFETVAIPARFLPWLNKFATADKEPAPASNPAPSDVPAVNGAEVKPGKGKVKPEAVPAA
jgi:hypothetical protein